MKSGDLLGLLWDCGFSCNVDKSGCPVSFDYVEDSGTRVATLCKTMKRLRRKPYVEEAIKFDKGLDDRLKRFSLMANISGRYNLFLSETLI